MKARTEFHPQEIEELYRQGAIRAPYREYLAEQERLRQQAEAEAARVAQARAASYSYSEPDSGYYEAPSDTPSEVSAPAPAPHHNLVATIPFRHHKKKLTGERYHYIKLLVAYSVVIMYASGDWTVADGY